MLNCSPKKGVAKLEEKVEVKPEETTSMVKDFMIQDVVSINPDASIKELLKVLTKHGTGGVPVVDSENKLIGTVSDGDIIRYLSPKEGSVHDSIYDIVVDKEETEQEVLEEKINTAVDKLMNTPHIYSVNEYDTFEKAIHILSQHRLKKLPVLDLDGKVKGIISRGDINNNLIKMLSEK